MKRRFILFFALGAILISFPTTKAIADCPAGLDPGRCFEAEGYRVETVPLQGPFPTINSEGNSVFAYKITSTTKKRKVKEADILIPVCTPGLGNPIAFSCGSPSCSGVMFTDGSGDPSTSFGLGLTVYDTWNWDWKEWWGDKPTQRTISFTFRGKVYAAPNAILVKVESWNRNRKDNPFGQILAPSCALVSPPTFPPQVPLATKKEEQIGDVKICSESTDQTGCATKVYTCSDSSYSACNCPEESKQYWPQKSLSDIGVVMGTLQQVWTDPDPRCPTTYMITSGSTCVKRCYPSGYCYVGPPGCK
jgi:hypothetical protein